MCYKESGFTQSVIAQKIGCSQSTISRELRRNSGQRGYRFKQAQRLSDERSDAVPRALKMTARMIRSIETLLAERWSPEQISGFLRESDKPHVSRERIYQHIWQDRKAGGVLYRYLRRKGRRYTKRGNGKSFRGQILGRVGIEERPGIVDEKSRIGDWEIDTVIGAKQKGVLVTLVERVTKFTLCAPAASKSAADVTATAVMLLAPYRRALKTITADNGKEFAWHDQITDFLGSPVYFARPYHSWERGLNENTNGLLRQYWPKGKDLSTISSRKYKRVLAQLNARPRKSLNYSSPAQKMNEYMASVAN